MGAFKRSKDQPLTELEIELMNALEALIDKYICNMGTDSEFISFRGNQGHGVHNRPWYWQRAVQAVAEANRIKECYLNPKTRP